MPPWGYFTCAGFEVKLNLSAAWGAFTDEAGNIEQDLCKPDGKPDWPMIGERVAEEAEIKEWLGEGEAKKQARVELGQRMREFWRDLGEEKPAWARKLARKQTETPATTLKTVAPHPSHPQCVPERRRYYPRAPARLDSPSLPPVTQWLGGRRGGPGSDVQGPPVPEHGPGGAAYGGVQPHRQRQGPHPGDAAG
jgi:hypothetical protein